MKKKSNTVKGNSTGSLKVQRKISSGICNYETSKKNQQKTME